jgi:hypothetical protein
VIAAEVGIYPSYVPEWGCLKSLRIVGVLSAYLPFPKASSLVVMFGAALARAVLGVANGMRLRFEPRLIYAITDPQTTETKGVASSDRCPAASGSLDA